MAKSGHLDYQTALSLTGYLRREVEYVPWVSALNGLSYIKTMLKRTAAYGEFKKLVFSFPKFKIKEPHISRYMLRLVDPIYRKLGFTRRSDDTHLDILLRRTAVGDNIIKWIFNMISVFSQVRWACSMGSEDCQEKAKEKFGNWMGMFQPDAELKNP